jgi:hypothetical protein
MQLDGGQKFYELFSGSTWQYILFVYSSKYALQ